MGHLLHACSVLYCHTFHREAKFVARLLATAGLWVRIQTSLKIQNRRHKQRSGQHTLQNKTLHTPTRTSPTEPDNDNLVFLKMTSLCNVLSVPCISLWHITVECRSNAGVYIHLRLSTHTCTSQTLYINEMLCCEM